MIVIAAVFVADLPPLKVYTAYEYLEHRFDVRVRYLGAFLFLLRAGLRPGITIYAPRDYLQHDPRLAAHLAQPRPGRASSSLYRVRSAGRRRSARTRSSR
jgi:hypothetical protein